MRNFAIVELGLVVNTVVANDESDISLTSNQRCIEYTESNPAVIGLRYEDGVFMQKEPYVPEPEYDADGNFIGLKAVPVPYLNPSE